MYILKMKYEWRNRDGKRYVQTTNERILDRSIRFKHWFRKKYASKAEELKPAAIKSFRKYRTGHITLEAYEASKIITKCRKALDWFDSSITCSICGETFNEADVNIVDYPDDVCVNCEPNYKEV